MWRMRDARRSTLHDWFDSNINRDKQIFEGASLRVESSSRNRENLPPLTTDIIKSLTVWKR